MHSTETSPIVVPRPAGGDIIIRQYLPKDRNQVYALLDEGYATGPGSPGREGVRKSLLSRVSFVSYFGFTLGALLLSQESRSEYLKHRWGGATLCLASIALFFYTRYSIQKAFLDYCEVARQTDMADITTYYRIPGASDSGYASETETDTQTPAHLQGPAGFWVAAIESESPESSEVVGYLGLEYHPGSSSGYLRRMVVSARHRRRRIGSLLITAVIDHAAQRQHVPRLNTLELETSAFQPPAQRLYQKHGFIVDGTRVMRLGPFYSVKVLHFSRKIEESE